MFKYSFFVNICPTDSWIEVSSQPSDDTYSSDEILTLSSPRGQHPRRKRKIRRNEILPGNEGVSKVYDNTADDLSEVEVVDGSSGPGSSIGELPMQEDFESSSSAAGEEDDGSEEEGKTEDEEDTGTMLGVGYRNGERTRGVGMGSSRIPPRYSTHSVNEFQRTLQPNPSHSFLRHRHTPSNSGAGSGRHLQPFGATKADHDEALMASLSTLLSCAAAARGLPRVSEQGASSPGGPSRVPTMSSSRVQLDTLQLVPDQVMAEKEKDSRGIAATSAPATIPPVASERKSTSTVSSNSGDHASRIRTRSSSNSRSNSKKRTESSSKKRSSSSSGKSRPRSSSPRGTSRLTSTLSSTDASLLTLAISAGAVIILSAISFSAGYVLGREVGKTEADAAISVVERTGAVVREAHRGGRGLVRGVGRVVSVSA